jgi:Flp pilus assembly protein TadG
MRRRIRDSKGSAIVEFAVVAPFLAFLLLGLIDVGRYTYDGILAAHAARAAVQYGAQNLVTAADTTGMKSAAAQDAQNLSNWSVTVTPMCNNNASMSACPVNSTMAVSANMIYYVQVTVTGTFNPLIAYPGIPTKIPVSATTTMRVDSQ